MDDYVLTLEASSPEQVYEWLLSICLSTKKLTLKVLIHSFYKCRFLNKL